MEIAITKISSKGQVVIPAEMRKNLNEGDKLIVIQNKDQIIMKKASDLDEEFQEEFEFARQTESAYQKLKKGKGTRMDFDEFLEELREW